MRRCEDEKMYHRPPLLEEPCAQTLSGKKHPKFAQMAFLIFFHGIFHGFSVVACSIDSQNLWKMQWKMREYLDSPNVGFSIEFSIDFMKLAHFFCVFVSIFHPKPQHFRSPPPPNPWIWRPRHWSPPNFRRCLMILGELNRMG